MQTHPTNSDVDEIEQTICEIQRKHSIAQSKRKLFYSECNEYTENFLSQSEYKQYLNQVFSEHEKLYSLWKLFLERKKIFKFAGV